VMSSGVPSQAAEAMYLKARVQFNMDALDSAEALVFLLVETYQSQSYWLGKSLLLLSDIYMNRGDLFQAKATLQSILDNYTKDDDVKALAMEKLQTVEELENAPIEEEVIEFEIELNQNDSEEPNDVDAQSPIKSDENE